MKTSYISVLLVVGVFGRVHTRVTSDTSAVSLRAKAEPPECRHQADPDSSETLPIILFNKQMDCYKASVEFLIAVNTAPDTDAFRAIFRSACTQEAAVRSCIADVTLEASPCLNDMEAKMFSTVTDFLDASITAMCTNGSEVIARMHGEEQKPLARADSLKVLGCQSVMKPKMWYDREKDLPAFTLRRYRAMKEFRSCVLDVAREAHSPAVWFGRFVGPILDTSKCIDAGTHEVVLCKTLDP